MIKKTISIFVLFAILSSFAIIFSGTEAAKATRFDYEKKQDIEIKSYNMETISEGEIKRYSSSSNSSVSLSDSVEKEGSNKYNISYNISIGKKDYEIDFSCSFKKLVTDNAYNGIIIAYNINTGETTIDISEINCVFQTKEYIDSMQLGNKSVNNSYRNVISFDCGDNIQYLGEQYLTTDMSALQIDEYITVDDGDAYLEAIGIIRNEITYTFEENEQDVEFWEPTETYIEELQNDLTINNISSEDSITSDGTIVPLALSTVGQSVRAIVNNDSWFKGTGKNMKRNGSNVCIKNSGYIGSAIYTDVIILQYSLQCQTGNSSSTHYTSIQLKVLYNVTVIYNNGTWSDLGKNSSSMTVRQSTIGTKTYGENNNDFIYQAVQNGRYNTDSGTSPSGIALRTLFYKALPLGGVISTVVDILDSYVRSKSGLLNGNFGIIDFNSNPAQHYSQNSGYVRNVMMSSHYCPLYKELDFQQQEVYIKKMPSGCKKYISFQSTFDVAGAYGSSITAIYTNAEYQQSQQY